MGDKQGLYRSDEEPLKERFAALQEKAERAWAQAHPMHEMYRTRLRRKVAGVAGMGGAAIVCIGVLFVYGRWLPEVSLVLLLFAAPLVGLLSGWLAGSWAQDQAMSRHRRLIEGEGDLRLSVERLTQYQPEREIAQQVQALGHISIAAPLMALSLLSPLLIHITFLGALEISSPTPFNWKFWNDAAEWIGISLIIVGHCHLVLAYLSRKYTKEMSSATSSQLEHLSDKGWRAWGVTTASSLFPGVLLIGIPVFLVGLTGVAFIPLMFGWAKRTLLREQRRLEEELRSFETEPTSSR